MQIKNKIGWVEISLYKKDEDIIKKWSEKNINKDDYFYTIINNKKGGGSTLDKLHLTLFYGLDASCLDKEDLKYIKIKSIEYLEE
jgi:hypothetical protein